MYGAGMTPSISISSANFSGSHLKAILPSPMPGSRLATQYIFSPTQKSRLCSQRTFSVVWGSARQNLRTHSRYDSMGRTIPGDGGGQARKFATHTKQGVNNCGSINVLISGRVLWHRTGIPNAARFSQGGDTYPSEG